MVDRPRSFNFGDFCWTELTSSNVQQAREFYDHLFDSWRVQINQFADGDYTFFCNDDGLVAGLIEQDDDVILLDSPSCWSPYIRVEKVDEAFEAAKGLGAKVAKAPYDVFEFGRGAVITDPQGALLYLWESTVAEMQPIDHAKAGAICLHELSTPNLEASLSFYSQLFGWTPERETLEDGRQFVHCFNHGKRVAVLRSSAPDNQHAVASWRVCFVVEACEAFVAHAQSMGAQVIELPYDHIAGGRYATFADPHGAHFSVMAPAIF